LAGIGPVTASSATLASNTAVSGLQTNVSTSLVLTGSAPTWDLTGTTVPTQIVIGTVGTFNAAAIGVPVVPAAVQTAVSAGQAAVQTATQTANQSSATSSTPTSTVTPATVNFSTSLSAPTSSPITISTAPLTSTS